VDVVHEVRALIALHFRDQNYSDGNETHFPAPMHHFQRNLPPTQNHDQDFPLPLCSKDESATMRWQQFIDAYDWKARLIPTAILLLPLFSTIYCYYPSVFGSPLQLAGSSLLIFALIYMASMFFRDLGVRYAKKFWKQRGGLPSTRFGRMRDSFLSHDQKNRIQLMILNRFGIKLMSFEEECKYPAIADRRIMDAFREIKEFLRRRRCELVDKRGAEYGFVRNLCGSRMIFVVQAISGIVICGFKGNWPHWNLTSGCWTNVVLLTFWVPFAWLVLPRMLMLNADAYAECAWVTFLSLAEGTSKKSRPTTRP
jgi:hypothetical protein